MGIRNSLATDELQVGKFSSEVYETIRQFLDNIELIIRLDSSFIVFFETYQGSYAEEPITRRDGSALQIGDIYVNETLNDIYSYTGQVWVKNEFVNLTIDIYEDIQAILVQVTQLKEATEASESSSEGFKNQANVSATNAANSAAAALQSEQNASPVNAIVDAISTVASKSTEVEVIASDLSGVLFEVGRVYDLGSITENNSNLVVSPDGYIVSVYNALPAITSANNNISTFEAVNANKINIDKVAYSESHIVNVSNNMNSILATSDHASSASTSATNANNSAQTALNHANDAKDYRDAAGTYVGNALSYSNTASNHKTSAENAATAANTSASNANTSATNAATSATNASSSASTANTQRIAAQAAKTDSEAARDASQGFRNEASTFASNASSSATTASTGASTATTKANEALAYRNKAEEWAEKGLNVQVETGKYSARHWALTVENALSTKVDKVNGKGLSTEDYTSDEKTKLAGIAPGAQVNTVHISGGNTFTGNQTVNGNLTVNGIVDFGSI